MVEFVATMSRHRGGPVLVGGVADRAARELGRVGQSGGQRQGTAIAPPKRAARPPVRPARVAEANRQTIGLGVGLSSRWSPAESGSIPERLSSVRTHAGAQDYPVYQYRTCPASPCRDRPHGYVNCTNVPARVICVYTPGGCEGFFEEAGELVGDVAQAVATPQPADPQRLTSIAARYGMSIIGGLPVS